MGSSATPACTLDRSWSRHSGCNSYAIAWRHYAVASSVVSAVMTAAVTKSMAITVLMMHCSLHFTSTHGSLHSAWSLVLLECHFPIEFCHLAYRRLSQFFSCVFSGICDNKLRHTSQNYNNKQDKTMPPNTNKQQRNQTQKDIQQPPQTNNANKNNKQTRTNQIPKQNNIKRTQTQAQTQ